MNHRSRTVLATQAVSTEAVLRAAGLRATRQRVAVMRLLERTSHLSAEAVHSMVQSDCHVSVQGVYDGLNALVEHGLAIRFRPAGRSAVYELHDDDTRHSHRVCRSCSLILDGPPQAAYVAPATPSTSDASAAAFDIQDVEVTFWGLCQDCR